MELEIFSDQNYQGIVKNTNFLELKKIIMSNDLVNFIILFFSS